MKILSFLFLTVILGKSCCDADAQSAKDAQSAVLEYTANTRGFYEKITVKNQTVAVSTDRDGADKPTAVKISDADWKMLTDAVSKIKLENLPNLKAPSEKRFHDGAPIASMSITLKDKTYQTSEFDHGNPPAEIATLVNKVVSFGKSR